MLGLQRLEALALQATSNVTSHTWNPATITLHIQKTTIPSSIDNESQIKRYWIMIGFGRLKWRYLIWEISLRTKGTAILWNHNIVAKEPGYANAHFSRVDEDEIELQTEALRKKLSSGSSNTPKSDKKGQFKPHQVHELAAAKIEESEKLRRALGISKDYEEGSHWKKQEERLRESLGDKWALANKRIHDQPSKFSVRTCLRWRTASVDASITKTRGLSAPECCQNTMLKPLDGFRETLPLWWKPGAMTSAARRTSTRLATRYGVMNS